jgi:hypothetical protein
MSDLSGLKFAFCQSVKQTDMLGVVQAEADNEPLGTEGSEKSRHDMRRAVA